MASEKRTLQGNNSTLEGLLLTNNRGSLVVIAHGYGGKPDAFLPLAETLTENHDVLVYAQRGHRFEAGKRSDYFHLERAIDDHQHIVSKFTGEYNSLGCFGFSTGATIAAYASEGTGALYLANPFLDVKDIRYVGHMISLAERAIPYGPMTIGSVRLEDVELEIPTRIAIAKNDPLIRNRSDNYRQKVGRENVIMVPGNHCFNSKGDRYLGKEGDQTNTVLYDDVSEFFNNHL